MKTTTTQDLLRSYVQDRSEPAFEELVNRYVDLVYSVAHRRVGGDMLLAEDVTQMVFSDLARKAGALGAGVMLGGWLHRHTGFVAGTIMRAEQRRRNRERQAVEMNALNEPADSGWKQLEPVLDQAIDRLEPPDHDAIILRFFERRDLRSVGAALGISDDAAQKRVSRAVEKLRELLIGQGGFTLPAAALALALGSQAVKAAPGGLAASAAGNALAQQSLVGAGLAALFLSWFSSTTAKLALGAVIVAGITTAVALRPARQSVPPTAVPEVASAAENAPSASAPADESLPPLTNPPPAETNVATANSNDLRLILLAADSGQPVPNAQIDYIGWEGGRLQDKKLFTDQRGQCDVPVPRGKITKLDLTTRVDGFADTRLVWSPDHGETIPSAYTLRLIRPASIGGRVVDEDGQTVADAKVGFNGEDDPASASPPESHEFGWIQVATDAEGRWSINRIAPEMIHRIYGFAGHPDHVGSAAVFTSRDHEAEQQLRQGTFTFHLGKAVTARGIVLDAEGAPIAQAKVLVGKRSMSDSRESKTESDGTFEIKGCRPGRTALTAEAAGFAATTIETELSAESGPVRLTLQRGNVLRLQVVNQDSRPVPNAWLWLDTFNNQPINSPSYGKLVVQADFNKTTDSEGRMVWSNAPASELVFDVQGDGCMRVNGFKVRADGQEHVVTLPPALVVRGEVRDASSGELIPNFRIITGWPETNYLDGSVNGQFSTIGRYWASYSGGKFRHVLNQPALGGGFNPGYMLKFDAEGYSPFVSRVIGAEEGEVHLEVALQPSRQTTVSVFAPDGSPAAFADVGLATPGARLRLAPGGFSRGANATALLQTDQEGRFQLQPDPAVTKVVIASRAGYAETTPAALAANSVLVLQPWGRVEGTFLKGNQPAPDCELQLHFPAGDLNTLDMEFDAFRATTDAQGHFVIAQAPPGSLKIMRVVHVQPNAFTSQAVPNGDVQIKPGQTTRVTLGSGGYTVTAHLRLPDDLKPGAIEHLMANVGTRPPAAMEAARQNALDPAAMRALAQSPEVREFQRNLLNFPASVSGDYTATAEGVPPGEFVFSAFVIPRQTDGSPPAGLSAYVPFTVPAEPPNGTIDLGEIALRRPETASR